MVKRKAKSAPARMDGAASGSVTRRKARNGPTETRAASSSPAPISRNAFLEKRTTKGKWARPKSRVAPVSPPSTLSGEGAPGMSRIACMNCDQPMAIISGGSTSGRM